MKDPDSEAARLENLRRVARHLQSGAPAQTARPREDASRTTPADPGSRGAAPAGGLAWLRRLGPVGVAIAALLGKGKFLLVALKLAKLQTAVTMLIAVWAYAMIWGVSFAIGFVLLIFVHEMGHALVMRRLGIPAGSPVFIPFVGAVIAMKGLPRNAYIEALVGIGGPVLGTAGAAVCLIVAATTGSQFWFALASTGFLINLFNMIPISPLDGGRIVGVISRRLWILGYIVGIVVFLVTYSPILFLILLLGLFTVLGQGRHVRPGYYDVPGSRRALMGAAYFGLMGLMALGMWAADRRLPGADHAGVESQAALLGLIHLLGNLPASRKGIGGDPGSGPYSFGTKSIGPSK